MMTRMKGWLLLIVLLVSGCAAEEAQPASETIVVGTSGNMVNLSYSDEGGQLTGYDIDVLRAIDERLPAYTFQFETMAFASLPTALEQGDLDVVANNLTKNDERVAKFLFHDQPYNVQPLHIVVNERTTDIVTMDDLERKTVGVVTASHVGNWLEDYVEKQASSIKIVYVEKPDDLMDYLKIGRIDATLSFQTVVEANNVHFDGQQKIVGEPLIYFSIYYMLNKQHAALAQQMDEVLAQLLEDGTIEALQQKWFGTSYSKEFLIERYQK